MANYTIWISSPSGERLAVIDRFIRLEYRRVVNRTGMYVAGGVRNVLPLNLVLLADALPLRFIERDSHLEIWRTKGEAEQRPAGSSYRPLRTQELDTETIWLVRRVRKLLTRDGQRLVELGAVPALAILNSRIVAYPAGSAQASKQGPADDVMKQIVRENFGPAATDPARDVGDWLNVAPDVSLAPVVSRSFARRNVLQVLDELAQASAEAGTPLYFDVVSQAPGQFEFRTYVGARGADHTFPNGIGPVVLAPETGTLAQVDRSDDYEDEYTVVYAAGQGVEAERLVAEAGDSPRIATSPFGRRERLVDARQVGNVNDLLAEARAALVASRPRRTFRASVVSTAGIAYGQHWRWGDRVTAAFEGEIIACHIDEVQVIVEAGRETVQATVRADGLAPLTRDSHLDRLVASESEATYQQMQREVLPADTTLRLPQQGQILVYGRYEVAGSLLLNSGAKLVIVV